MSGIFEFMIRPVYKYEGTVSQLMGDAILAFFGEHQDNNAHLRYASGIMSRKGMI